MELQEKIHWRGRGLRELIRIEDFDMSEEKVVFVEPGLNPWLYTRENMTD